MIFNFNAAEVFNIAIQIEDNGKRFYERSLKLTDDSGIKKLFEELGQQEVEHKKRFQTLKEQLPPQASASTGWDPNNEMDSYIKMMADQHIFVGDIESQLSQLKDVKDALKMAIEFEKDSVIFFLSVQEATDEARGKELIGSLVKEEQEHLRRLSLELARLGRK